MRMFTKILKPVFGWKKGYFSIILVNDSYLQGNTERQCLENIEVTVNLLIKLGFKIYELNSTLKPTQGLEFPSFFINSKNMTLSIKKDRSQHIALEIKNLLSDPPRSLRKLSSVIGFLNSMFPEIPFGKLHCRNLEKEKTMLLKKTAWDFERKVCISTFATDELKWWFHASQML